ncbi:MAG: hypothetical protein OHK0022_13570 [Roseiflexaceae bacterium]
MSEKHKDVAGTLFRGADGNLYFIPDSYLPAFRVFKSAQGKVERLLKGHPDAATLATDEAAAAATPDAATLGNVTSDAAKAHADARLEAVHATIPIAIPDPKAVTTQASIISASVQSEIE